MTAVRVIAGLAFLVACAPLVALARAVAWWHDKGVEDACA